MAEIPAKSDISYYKKNFKASKNSSADPSENSILSAVMSSPNTEITPDSNVMIIISIENLGEEIIDGLVVSDLLSISNLTYVKNSALFYIEGQPPTAIEPKQGSDADFSIPVALETGSALYFSFLAKAKEINPQTQSIFNYALVYSADYGISTETNSIRFSSEYAQISAEKTGVMSESGCSGDTIYTITLSNNGNIPACNITVTDVLAENFKVTKIFYNGEELNANTDYTIDNNNLITITLPQSITIEPTKFGVIQIMGSFQ